MKMIKSISEKFKKVRNGILSVGYKIRGKIAKTMMDTSNRVAATGAVVTALASFDSVTAFAGGGGKDFAGAIFDIVTSVLIIIAVFLGLKGVVGLATSQDDPDGPAKKKAIGSLIGAAILALLGVSSKVSGLKDYLTMP